MDFNSIAYFNSNDGTSFIGFGVENSLRLTNGNSIDEFEKFVEENNGKFILLALSYDLKNEIENLESKNQDGIKFPKIIAWTPAFFVEISSGKKTFLYGKESSDSRAFIDVFLNVRERNPQKNGVNLKPRISKQEYLEKVIQLKNEIQKGNIYEVNYCQEFYAHDVLLNDRVSIYHRLNEVTSAPFSNFLQFDEFTIFGASPERFLKKVDARIISQPIKGTIRRGKNTLEDDKLRKKLLNDPKEKAENVMIVDLVRNDLSKIAKPNSVKVDELFGIYSFKTVHQMISTISCELKPNSTISPILRATFPMGSMTGAPKVSAMKLIEKHEDFKRGLYAGSIGFMRPNGDFDFNVVIRSLIYNEKEKYLSCSVGGAITSNSTPESEFEECETKIKKIRDLLND